MNWDQTQLEAAKRILDRRTNKGQSTTGLVEFVGILTVIDHYKKSTQDCAAKEQAIELLVMNFNQLLFRILEEMDISVEEFVDKIHKETGRDENSEFGMGGDWWKHGHEPD